MLQARQYKSNCCQIILPVLCLIFIFIIQLLVNVLIRSVATVDSTIPAVPMTHGDAHAVLLLYVKHNSKAKPKQNTKLFLHLSLLLFELFFELFCLFTVVVLVIVLI